jgi:MFS family permease
VRWLLTAGYLFLVFLLGGGSRADVSSLIFLRPLSVIVCGFALWTLTIDQVRAHLFLFVMTGAIFALVLVHLIPLPPALWTLLPGRDLVARIDDMAGLGAVWRPITLVPEAGWNAFYALFVPLAVLLLGVQLDTAQRQRLLYVVLGFALVSALLGLLQSIGGAQSIFYFYRISSETAVGLFANRNHQAMTLAITFPLLAVYASTGARTVEKANLRLWAAVAVGVVLVPLILVTGSRAGLVLGLLGFASALMLYRKPQISIPKKRRTAKIDWRYPIAVFVVLCLGGATVVMSRAEALRRLLDPEEDKRFQLWSPVLRMAGKYFPFGSGVGSYVEVYQVDEPYGLLNFAYSNHAHNDWLEVVLTTGLGGAVLLIVAAVAFGRVARAVFRRHGGHTPQQQYRRLGCVVIGLLALGSVADYPLRTPTLASIFVIAALWASTWPNLKNAG